MLTLTRVLTFVHQYRTLHAGEFPPYIELSEEEAAQVADDVCMYQNKPNRANPDAPMTIHGIKVRVIDTRHRA